MIAARAFVTNRTNGAWSPNGTTVLGTWRLALQEWWLLSHTALFITASNVMANSHMLRRWSQAVRSVANTALPGKTNKTKFCEKEGRSFRLEHRSAGPRLDVRMTRAECFPAAWRQLTMKPLYEHKPGRSEHAVKLIAVGVSERCSSSQKGLITAVEPSNMLSPLFKATSSSLTILME